MSVSIEEAVENGASLLDIVEPGWADKVDLNVFEMESPMACVLGQVFGDYIIALEVLENETDELFVGYRNLQRDYGFDLTVDEYESVGKSAMFGELEEAWLNEINMRL